MIDHLHYLAGIFNVSDSYFLETLHSEYINETNVRLIISFSFRTLRKLRTRITDPYCEV